MNKEQTPGNDSTRMLLEKTFRKKNLIKGTVYFIVFTVLGLAAIFFITNTPETLQALHHLKIRFFLIAIALSVLDMQLGAWRNHIFIRKIDSGISTWVSWRANVANIFMGAVTPSQSGGGPAQLFIYYRAGIPIAKSISVSIINFIATLAFFLVFAVFALNIVREQFSSGTIQYLIQYGFVAFIGLFVIIIIVIWKPEIIGRWIIKLSNLIMFRKDKWKSRSEKFHHRLVLELNRYKEQCKYFYRSKPELLFYSVVITCVLYINKFTLAYFLMRGLGVNGNIVVIMAIQILILFILYFSPSPGGSGIAELSIAALMAILMPKHILPLFTLLYRFFLLYLPAALGSVVVLTELNKQQKEI